MFRVATISSINKTSQKRSLFSHIISSVFVATLNILLIFDWNWLYRLWEAIKTFGLGIIYYFINLISDSVVVPPTSFDWLINNANVNIFLPVNYENLGDYFKSAFMIAFNRDYFVKSLTSSNNLITVFRYILTIGLVILCLLIILYLLVFESKSTRTGKTKTLAFFEKIKTTKLTPYVINPIKFFINFLETHKYYPYLALLILLLKFNLISLCLEFFGYVFIFISTFDIKVLFYLAYTILYTTLSIVNALPLIVTLTIIYTIIRIITIKNAKNKLEGFDNKNCEFANNLGVATYIYGPPGCGKTKLMTDLVLSTDKNFRMQAFSILKKCESLCPNINFKAIRTACDRLITDKKVDNRIQLSNLIRSLPSKALNHFAKKDCCDSERYRYLFNYDLLLHPEIWVGNMFVNFDMLLQAYSEAYYLYINPKPMIFSNYPIRYDYFLDDEDYFKTWNDKIFDINKNNFKTKSQYSSIVNFDELRLGNRYCGYTGMIDSGVVAITEIDKERGNKFNLEGLNRNSKSPNLKNDLFNPFWKLGRHPSTTDHYPFIKLYADLQRPDSLNVDLLDSGEMMINIESSDKNKTALHLSSYSNMLVEWIYNITDNLLFHLKKNRNYDSLFENTLKSINSFAYNFLNRRINIFSYEKMNLKISTSRKDQDVNIKASPYFLITKKIYGQRYATDVYRLYFEKMFERKKFKKSERNFTTKQYSDIYATFDEFHEQNSFMINDIESCQALKFNGENDKKTMNANKKATSKPKNPKGVIK